MQASIAGGAPLAMRKREMDYFLGQILFGGFGFAPKGCAEANGQTLSISQNSALFALLGVSYGGNGQNTFNLPDLRGRAIVGFANGGLPADRTPLPIGAQRGSEAVALTAQQLPAHTHPLSAAAAAGTTSGPTAATFGVADGNVYTAGSAGVAVLGGAPSTVAGGGQPHSNMQPYGVILAAIVLDGIFPARQ